MYLLKYLSIGLFVLSASCSSKSPVLPVQGDLIGRSERFCISSSERVAIGDGYVCLQYSKFFLEVETHYSSNKDDIKFAIADAFERNVLARIKELHEKANVNTDVYYQGPIRGFDNDIRLLAPIENALRIEVHLMEKEVDVNNLNIICQDYWLLMLTRDMYLRTINKSCQDESPDYINKISSNIIDDVYDILEDDIFK